MDAAGYVRLQSGIQRKKAAGLMRSSGHRTEAADCYRLAEVLSNIAAQIEEAARFDGGSAEGKTYTLPTEESLERECSSADKFQYLLHAPAHL